MNRKRWSAGLLGLALAIGLASPAWADPPAGVPGGPCIEDQQQVQLDSLPSYQEVARQLASIEQSSQGAVEVRSAGRSGEGRELLYATVGHGPGRLLAAGPDPRQRAAQHRGRPADPQVPGSSGSPEATRIRERSP